MRLLHPLVLFVRPSDIVLVCRGILNLCCPYTSQEEIATAVKRTVDSCAAGSLSIECVPLPHSSSSCALADVFSLRRRDITEDAIAANLYTAASPPLDILIRTSGVSRLSDFLLWQVRQLSL